MNVIIQILGREAIPVRALPYLTHWEKLSPDVVAKALGGNDNLGRFKDLYAYSFESGVVRPIHKNFWRNIATPALDGLSAEIAIEYPEHAIGYDVWQLKSLKALPAGIFVWKDEWEQEYRIRYLSASYMRLNDSGQEMAPNERHKLLALDYEPFIPESEKRIMVMEGFESLLSPTESAPAQTADTPATVKPVQRSTAQDAAILHQLNSLGYDPLAVPKNESGKAGAKSAVRNALNEDRLFAGSTVFDKAWERLSKSGEIVILK